MDLGQGVGRLDDLVDQLLLSRGVERDDLERHRRPTLRDFLPNPSIFRDMDRAAARLADAVSVSASRRGPISPTACLKAMALQPKR